MIRKLFEKSRKYYNQITCRANLSKSIGDDGTMPKYDRNASIESVSVLSCNKPLKYLSGAVASYCSMSMPTTKYSPVVEEKQNEEEEGKFNETSQIGQMYLIEINLPLANNPLCFKLKIKPTCS